MSVNPTEIFIKLYRLNIIGLAGLSASLSGVLCLISATELYTCCKEKRSKEHYYQPLAFLGGCTAASLGFGYMTYCMVKNGL